PEEEAQILQAILEAEKNTSGEIRVHLELFFKGDLMDHAVYIFNKLGMHKTALRNGVLFYIGLKNRQFAILGDQGINQVVPPGFWDRISDYMREEFAKGKFFEGLTQGILLAGEQLKAHFPIQADDRNELSNDISFS
ncbi:MAG: TPM domain-containing protein, partial [Bacteroidales bacterium]|nr:TPM domain-containing protein [Bacteroidales bacterium]